MKFPSIIFVLLLFANHTNAKRTELNCTISNHKICQLVRANKPLQKLFFQNFFLEKMDSFTNEVYKIETNYKSYIIRLPSDTNELLIFKNGMDHENRNLIALKETYDHIPTLILYKEGHYSVFEYISHHYKLKDKDLKNSKTLVEVVKFLKKLHLSKIKFSNNKNVFKELKQGLEILNDGIEDYEKREFILSRLNLIETRLDISPNKYVPIHGDPVASNILVTKNENIVLIDWEYSGNFDGLWDLALLSINANFSKKDDIGLINLYAGNFNKELYDKFIVYKSLVHLWKYLWFKLRSIKIDESAKKESHLKFASEEYDKFVRDANKLNLI